MACARLLNSVSQNLHRFSFFSIRKKFSFYNEELYFVSDRKKGSYMFRKLIDLIANGMIRGNIIVCTGGGIYLN